MSKHANQQDFSLIAPKALPKPLRKRFFPDGLQQSVLVVSWFQGSRSDCWLSFFKRECLYNFLSSNNGEQIFIHHPAYNNQLKTYIFYDTVHIIRNGYCFPLRSYKKGPFFFYIMYFLLYNPNLKSVFCGRTIKYVFLCF